MMELGAKILGLEVYLPGDPISVGDLGAPEEVVQKLENTGQRHTYLAEENSTELSMRASQLALESSRTNAKDIAYIISAPTLLTSHGLEIPAIAIRAGLHLENAQCLNIAQGCAGIMVGLRVANALLRDLPLDAKILVVAACKASTLMENLTHGAFFWGDGAAAMIVGQAADHGLHFMKYAEAASEQDWLAMQVRHGDFQHFKHCDPKTDLRLSAEFPDPRAQADYIAGEIERCSKILLALTQAESLPHADIEAIFLPSIGQNRMPSLFSRHPELMDKLASNFETAHLGGIDTLLYFKEYIDAHPPQVNSCYLALTPAYTAHWSGISLKYISAPSRN